MLLEVFYAMNGIAKPKCTVVARTTRFWIFLPHYAQKFFIFRILNAQLDYCSEILKVVNDMQTHDRVSSLSLFENGYKHACGQAYAFTHLQKSVTAQSMLIFCTVKKLVSNSQTDCGYAFKTDVSLETVAHDVFSQPSTAYQFYFYLFHETFFSFQEARLEWLIIWLIVIEVFFAVIDHFGWSIKEVVPIKSRAPEEFIGKAWINLCEEWVSYWQDHCESRFAKLNLN